MNCSWKQAVIFVVGTSPVISIAAYMVKPKSKRGPNITANSAYIVPDALSASNVFTEVTLPLPEFRILLSELSGVIQALTLTCQQK